VPEQLRVTDALGRIQGVAVIAAARELNDAKSHLTIS
jgi:hypothetical protein